MNKRDQKTTRLTRTAAAQDRRRVYTPSTARIAVAMLAVVLSAAACGRPQPASTPVAPRSSLAAPADGRGVGDVLRLLYWEAPTMLNPHLTTGIKDWEAARITYEPLASFDKAGNLVPFLAERSPSLENGDLAANGKSVIWRLKQGVKWSDGQPFTADDVRFTFDYISNPAVGATSAVAYGHVQSVDVIDDHTVRVNFKDVDPAWTLPFVGVWGMILPRHVFEPYNGQNARQAPANNLPVGTGPYRVTPPGIKPQEVLFLGNQLIQTNKIVYEPNPFFREPDKPYFRRVELRGGGTVDATAAAVLRDGTADLAYNLSIPAADLVRLQAQGKGYALYSFGSTVEQLEFNRTNPTKETADGERSNLQFPHPFFSDKRVRQAFVYAIDREAIASLYGPAGRTTSNILVAPDQYNSPNTTYEFNLDKAAALLDEAGWVIPPGKQIREKDGVALRVVFQTSENSVRQHIQEIIQKALQSIGVDVIIRFYPAGDYLGGDPNTTETVEHFYADMQEYDISAISPEPSLFTEYWTTGQIPQKANNWLAGLNTARWYQPAYDALHDQATRELDPEKRRQLFIRMNDMLIEDVVMVPLVRLARVSGISKSLQGVDLTPWDSAPWNIKDWRRSAP